MPGDPPQQVIGNIPAGHGIVPVSPSVKCEPALAGFVFRNPDSADGVVEGLLHLGLGDRPVLSESVEHEAVPPGIDPYELEEAFRYPPAERDLLVGLLIPDLETAKQPSSPTPLITPSSRERLNPSL